MSIISNGKIQNGEEVAYKIVNTASELFDQSGISKILLGLIWEDPYKKRSNGFLNELSEKLQKLQENQIINIDNLKDDQLFLTNFIQICQISIKTHNEKKLDALGNIAINSALKIDITEDIQQVIIEHINQLTALQISALKFFVDNENELKNIESFEDLRQKFIEKTCTPNRTRPFF